MVAGMKLGEILSMSSAAKKYAINKGAADIKRILNNDDTDEEKLKLIESLANTVALRYEEFILHFLENIANIMDEAQEKEKEAIINALKDTIESEE